MSPLPADQDEAPAHCQSVAELRAENERLRAYLTAAAAQLQLASTALARAELELARAADVAR